MRPTGTIWFDLPQRFDHTLRVCDTPVNLSSRGQKAWLDEDVDALTLRLDQPVALLGRGVPVFLHGLELDKREPRLYVQAQIPLRHGDAERWLATSPESCAIAKVARLTRHRGAALAGAAAYTLATGGLGPVVGLLAGALLLKHATRRGMAHVVRKHLPDSLQALQPLVDPILTGAVVRVPVELGHVAQSGAQATAAVMGMADHGLQLLRGLSEHVDFGQTDLHFALHPAHSGQAGPDALAVRDVNLHVRPTPGAGGNAVRAHLQVQLRYLREAHMAHAVDVETDFWLPKPRLHPMLDQGVQRPRAQADAEHFVPASPAFIGNMHDWLSGMHVAGQLTLRDHNKFLAPMVRLKIDSEATLDVTTVSAPGRPNVVRLIPPEDSSRNVRVKLRLEGHEREQYNRAERTEYVHRSQLKKALKATSDVMRQALHNAGLSITYLQAVDITPAAFLPEPGTHEPLVHIKLSHGFRHVLAPRLILQSSNKVWESTWLPDDISAYDPGALLLTMPRYMMPIDPAGWHHWTHVANGVVRFLDRVDCRRGRPLDVSCFTAHAAEVLFGVERAQRSTSAVFHVAAAERLGRLSWTTTPLRAADYAA